MASEGDDGDLDALRLAVLASFKKRGKQESQYVSEDSRHDEELIQLRNAALQSKGIADPDNFLQAHLCHTTFHSNHGYQREFINRKGFNRNANLIVINPIEESTPPTKINTVPQSADDSHVGIDNVSHSPHIQRPKSSGKFSRFDSDSDSSSESSDYSEDFDSQSITPDEDGGNTDSEDKTKDKNDESILFLHPDEDLPDNEHVNASSGLPPASDVSNHLQKVDELKALVNSGRKKGSASSSLCERNQGVCDKEKTLEKTRCSSSNSNGNSDERRRSARDGHYRNHIGRNGERHRHRHGDDERRKHKTAAGEVHHRSVSAKDGVRRLDRPARVRVRSPKRLADGGSVSTERSSKRRQRSRSRGKTGDNVVPSVVVMQRTVRSPTSVTTERLKTSPARDLPNNHGDSMANAVRHRSSPCTHVDLREKLSSRKREQKKKDGNEVSHDQEDDTETKSPSSSERESSPIVKSVLSVVKVGTSLPEDKSRRHNAVPPYRERHVRTSERRKSASPEESTQQPKVRKVFIVDDGKLSTEKIKESSRTRINVSCVDDLPRSRESSPVKRIPVRERLGMPTKTSQPTKNSTSPSRPAPLEKAVATSPTRSEGTTHAKSRFKVKLCRDVTMMGASSASKEDLPKNKSQICKGKPSYENELDERIRRIQAKNAAILKRKNEIAWDQHKHY